MADPRHARGSVSAVSLIVLGEIVYTLANSPPHEADEWFMTVLAVILACLAAGVVAAGQDIHRATVLSLLLGSFASILGVRPTDWTYSAGAPGHYVGLAVISAWYILFLLSPFLFVHLSLIFPVPNRWIDQNPRRLFLVYVPYLLLLAPLEWQVAFDEGIGAAFDYALLLVFPAGFALGLSVFVYQYLVALTPAEKNRLRVILIGCLAGGAPYVLVLAARTFGLGGPSFWEYLAYFLVPLFPLSLVFAVLHGNFYNLGHAIERSLLFSLVAAGAISVFYLTFLVLRSQSSEVEGPGSKEVLIALLLAVIVVYPIQRWAWAYVPPLFYRTPKRPLLKPPPSDFTPIRPNPYIVGNPVRSNQMFFGRKEELRFIKTRLQGQHEGCVILLFGDRRAGKTSILHQIVNGRLGSRFLPVFVDMQGMVVENDREFLQAMAATIRGCLTADGKDGDSLDPGAIGGYFAFTSFMDAALDLLGDRQLVLLIDEYELIEHKVQQGKIGGEVFDYWTSLLERCPKQLSLVLTGSRSLEAHRAWHSMAGKSFARKVSFLSWQDATDLICEPLQGRVTFSGDAVGDLLRLTHGQPFFTQLLCQTAVEVLNEQCVNRVERDTVTLVTERVLENPPPQLVYQWNGFSPPDKLLLAALGALLKTPESLASSDWLERSVQSLPREHRQGLDGPGIRMLLENMRQRDVLDRDQTRYRFTMDLMRRWVRSEHSVWSVLEQNREFRG